jgi:hypothetical protein
MRGPAAGAVTGMLTVAGAYGALLLARTMATAMTAAAGETTRTMAPSAALADDAAWR